MFSGTLGHILDTYQQGFTEATTALLGCIADSGFCVSHLDIHGENDDIPSFSSFDLSPSQVRSITRSFSRLESLSLSVAPDWRTQSHLLKNFAVTAPELKSLSLTFHPAEQRGLEEIEKTVLAPFQSNQLQSLFVDGFGTTVPCLLETIKPHASTLRVLRPFNVDFIDGDRELFFKGLMDHFQLEEFSCFGLSWENDYINCRELKGDALSVKNDLGRLRRREI